jgi:hypothetical protein
VSPARRTLLKHASAAGLSLLIPDTLDSATFAPTRNMQRDDSGGGALRLDLRHFTVGGAEHFKLERLRFEPSWARSKAARAASYLFSVDPFRKRARDFNVRSVFAASVDSGVTDPYLGLRKNTVLRCAYQTGEAERTLAVRHGRALREIASAVPYDFLLVLANSRRYGGSAVFGGPAVVAIDSAAARYLVVHEFAHVIGGLADEYYIPAAGGPAFVGNVEPWNPNVTVSFENGKWDHLARDTARRATVWNKSEYDAHFSNYVKRYFALRAAHADEALVERLMYQAGERSRELLAKNGNARRIGWFEGANGYGKGAFRAEVDCIMFSFQTRYFCSACSAAIERMTDAHCA